MKAINFFKFLEKKEGRDLPFKAKLIYNHEQLTPEDLNVKGNLDLADTEVTSLPSNLKVGGKIFKDF